MAEWSMEDDIDGDSEQDQEFCCDPVQIPTTRRAMRRLKGSVSESRRAKGLLRKTLAVTAKHSSRIETEYANDPLNNEETEMIEVRPTDHNAPCLSFVGTYVKNIGVLHLCSIIVFGLLLSVVVNACSLQLRTPKITYCSLQDIPCV